ncbi:MAG: hypothetical protein RLZZ612_876 [Pseudomonadota bacterium]|jgi:hypothetical protein
MKWFIWMVTAVVLACWTLLISAVAGVASWVAAQGDQVLPGLGQGYELSWPSGLADVLPAVWLDPIKQYAEQSWASFLAHWPSAASALTEAVGWIVPMAWALWAVLALLWLLLAVGLHLWVTRYEGRQPQKCQSV